MACTRHRRHGILGDNPSYRSLFRSRSFSSLWTAQVVSQSGDAIFDVALLLLVFDITKSFFLVGLTQAIVLIPSLVVGPVAGVYADRLDRRSLMIWSNISQGMVTAVVSFLYLTSNLNFSVLLLLVLFLYSGAQFYLAANSAIIPRIVGKENLGAANGLFTLSTSTNQLVSYSLGGIIVAAFGFGAPVTYDSLTFFFAAALLTLVARTYGQSKADAPIQPPRSDGMGFWKNFREGLSYVRHDRLFLELIALGLVVNGFAGGVFALLVPYAKVQLKGGDPTYGFLLAAFLLGTTVGSIAMGKVNFRRYVGKLLILGVIVFGLILGVAGLITSAPLALALFFLEGAVIACVNIPITSLVQTKIPGELLGRTTTVLRAFLSASQPAASLLAGAIASATSIGAVFAGSGVTIAISMSLAYAAFAQLRNANY